MKMITLIYAFLIAILLPVVTLAVDVADLLITQDIGQFMFRGKGGGQGSGILSTVDHFSKDHIDESYSGVYFNKPVKIGVNVEVTRHVGSDSDKWLLHEVEQDFRNYFGMPGRTYGPRVINGQTILEDTVGGVIYRWISGTKIINIQYIDLDMAKPEPIEVVQAYLAKHPSTLPAMTLQGVRSTAGRTTWIKDEMDRRLWLCDKWFMQLQLKKADEKQVYQESVKSMMVFLDYRDKYYAIKSANDKELLIQYLRQNNGTGIKAKLIEYKNWWAVNREKVSYGDVVS
jgi:hypothetical protein